MRRQKKKTNKHILFLTALIFLVIGVITGYTLISRHQIRTEAKYTLEQKTHEVSNELEAYFDLAGASIQLTSQLVTRSMSGPTLENAGAVLKSVGEKTPFHLIEYMNQDGINMTDEGAPFDASDRVYYQEGIKGNTGVWVNYHPKYSGEYLLNFYTPLYYEEEIVGVLTGVLGANTDMKPVLETSLYGNKMIGLLCDEKGQIIASGTELKKDMFLDEFLSEAQVNEENQKLLQKQFQSGNNKSVEFRTEKGKSLACICSISHGGWRVFLMVPLDSYDSLIKENTRSTYGLMAIIVLLVFLYFLYLQMDFRRWKKIQRQEKEEAVEGYQQILTAAAADTAKGIRRIDLETGMADYIYFEEGQIKKKAIGGWVIWLERQKRYIDPEDVERVNEFSSLAHLRTMKEGVTYTQSYHAANRTKEGYQKTYTSTVSINNVGGRKTAIMAIVDNTNVVMMEMEREKLLASAASIYISMYVLDLKNDSLEELHCAEHIRRIIDGRKNNIQLLIHDAMRKLTDEQHLEEMMEFLDLSTLNERMKKENTITMEFLGKMSGWCRTRFIAVDCDDKDCFTRVLWVIENIDKEKRKANHLKYLSETDLMTGIRNRGSGERKIKELIESGHEGAFCLLDADRFKRINDTYGHGVGDKVLIAIAEALKASFREEDVILRLGGDEFAIFIDGITDEDTVKQFMEKLLEKVQEIHISDMGEERIAISAGVAVKRNGDGVDFEALYRNADSCTYQSKCIQGNAYKIFNQ